MVLVKPIPNVIAILYCLVALFQNEQYKTVYNQEQNSKMSLYWFDVSTNEFLLYGESTNCDHSNINPCALGYYNVSDPFNPQKPNRYPDIIETGERP